MTTQGHEAAASNEPGKSAGASHTPGPWHRNIKPATKYNTVWSGRNTHVARVVVDGRTPEQVEADICLIAAAPDLLDALEAACEWLEGSEERSCRDAAKEYRAAIARATGAA